MKKAVSGKEEAEAFLEKYGYLHPEPNVHNDFEAALGTFQRHKGLMETQEVDEPTQQAMNRPRCSVPDSRRYFEPEIKKIAFEDRDVAEITWAIHDFHKPKADAEMDQHARPDIYLSEKKQIKLITEAFDLWQEHLPARFVKVEKEDNADIKLGWFESEHKWITSPKLTAEGFDGPGHILAYANSPEHKDAAGEIHFDNGEFWVPYDDYYSWNVRAHYEKKRDPIDLLTVAIHEIGHALGLEHVHTEYAVMYPDYLSPRRMLDRADIAALKEKYKRPRVHRR